MTIEKNYSPLHDRIAFGDPQYTNEVNKAAETIPNIKPGAVPMYGLFSHALALQNTENEIKHDPKTKQFLTLFHHAIEWVESRNEKVTFERVLIASQYILASATETKLPEPLEEITFEFKEMAMDIVSAQLSIVDNGLSEEFNNLDLGFSQQEKERNVLLDSYEELRSKLDRYLDALPKNNKSDDRKGVRMRQVQSAKEKHGEESIFNLVEERFVDGSRDLTFFMNAILRQGVNTKQELLDFNPKKITKAHGNFGKKRNELLLMMKEVILAERMLSN